MKNFLGKLRSLGTEKKALYFSAFILICFMAAMPAGFAQALDINLDVGGMLGNWVRSFVFDVVYIIFKFAALLVYFAAWLVDVMLNPEMYKAVLVGTPDATTGANTGAVQLGWSTIRDFCNMFYVFFLLLIAFGTITGSSTYNYKNLLPKFIISLFLINFSMIITEMVIDVGQVFLFGMAAWLGTFSGPSGSGSALTGIVDYFQQVLGSLENPSFQDIVNLIFAMVYTFVLAAVYLVMAGLLLFRLLMFACLIIVSPFAFFSMVLPSTQKYTSQWRGLLISNAISGPVLLFFVYISAMMAKNLVDHPIAITVGDTSKMGGMENILARIVPHIVAMGILLYGVAAAKSVGAYGAEYVIGGRFGVGKMMGMSYAAAKLGERAARRTAGGAAKGIGSAWNLGKRNSSQFAGASDDLHKVGQDIVGWAGAKVPGGLGVATATGIIQKDMAAQEAAKERIVSERLKKYGGNLKALDVDLLLKGDNVDKALALKAAAEQGKLGNPALLDHFSAAQSVMSHGDIKGLTGKNLAFNTVTSENANKRTRAAFAGDAEAQGRIDASMALGMSEEDATRREIMVQAAKKAILKGEDAGVQGLDQAENASVMIEAYKATDQIDELRKKPISHKKALVQGVTKHIENIEGKRQAATNDKEKEALESNKLEFASAAIKSGASVDSALAAEKTLKAKEGSKEFEKHANMLFEQSVKVADIAAMSKGDKEKHGFRASKETIAALRKKRDPETLNAVRNSLAYKMNRQTNIITQDPNGPSAAELDEKIKVAGDALT